MDTTYTSLIVLACLIAAVLAGRILRGLLPESHLSSESKDAVKLALGLVATMSALVLGLLVSSAKDAYDVQRSEVIQMSAKITFLDRILAAYGPEAAGIRTLVRGSVEEGIRQLWPGEMRRPAQVAPNVQTGNMVYIAIHGLSPHNDMQSALKTQAATVAVDIAQVRTLIAAQSVPSISKPMLIILVSWLVIIFLGFSVLAPRNPTAILAFMVSAVAVSAAIFLILELDQAFGGLIGISSEPMVNALQQLAQ